MRVLLHATNYCKELSQQGARPPTGLMLDDVNDLPMLPPACVLRLAGGVRNIGIPTLLRER